MVLCQEWLYCMYCSINSLGKARGQKEPIVTVKNIHYQHFPTALSLTFWLQQDFFKLYCSSSKESAVVQKKKSHLFPHPFHHSLTKGRKVIVWTNVTSTLVGIFTEYFTTANRMQCAATNPILWEEKLANRYGKLCFRSNLKLLLDFPNPK